MEISARKARSARGNDRQIHVFGEWLLFAVNSKDLFALRAIRKIQGNTTIKAAGAKKSGIEHVRAVSSSKDDYFFIRLESVHFDENLIKRLLAFIVSAANAGATTAADRIDFINENNRRG